MAAFSLINPVVTVNAVNLSQHVRSVTFSVEVADNDSTSFGSGGSRERVAGLKDGSISIEFNQDFAAAQVDATLWPLVGTLVTVTAKPTSAATSATNPLYSASCLVTGYTPLANGVGELATVSVTWPTSGAVSRAVA